MSMGLHWQRGIMPLFIKALRQEAQTWWMELITTTATPLTFLLAFGLGLRDTIGTVEGVSYAVFLVPGLVSLTILLEAYRTGVWGIWLDQWHLHTMDEYRVKPISTSDIIIGQILGGMVVGILKGLVVGLIMLLVFPFTTSLASIAGYLGLMLLGSILFTCLGCMVGTMGRKPDQIAQIQTIIITPLLYLGGLFFPIDHLPDGAERVVRFLPTAALFDGGRHMLLFGTLSPHYIVIIILFAILAFIGAVRLFNHKMGQ